MSSFNCPKCGTFLHDIPGKGYVTQCVHFPIESKEKAQVPQFLKDMFLSH